MMGLAVITGALILQQSISFPPLLLGFVTAFTLTGAIMVTNDYWDRFVDAVNEPGRPIPSGRISTDEALIYALTLIIAGLTSAYLTNLACLVVSVISLLISLTYNTKGKQAGLLGNFMVSAIVVIPLIYGGVIYKGFNIPQQEITLTIVFSLMVFLSITGREITKGISDMEGDKIRNIKTIALKYDRKTAAVMSSTFYLLAVVLSIIVWFSELVSWLYIPIVIIADLGFIWSSLLLIRDYSRQNAKKIKKTVLVWMLIGLLAFVAGGF
jgi:geranylgeranylglycerol-phosphate geranylgeranyltransferase